MKDSWDAKSYSQFLDLRTRPARDLLGAIPQSFHPSNIYDLGCGPGNSTALLKERWPNAKIVGLDSSPDMLKKARTSYPDIQFIHEDIAHFSPYEKLDCFFANASLQWLDAHEILIPKLLNFLTPGGTFGIQMPNNFHSPSHQVAIQLLQDNVKWQPLLNNLTYGILTEPLFKLSWYYDLLTRIGVKNLQLWETEYLQELPEHQAIFEWVQATGLRPAWSELDSENQIQFTKFYLKAIKKAYPLQSNKKVLFPYRRIFIVGNV